MSDYSNLKTFLTLGFASIAGKLLRRPGVSGKCFNSEIDFWLKALQLTHNAVLDYSN